MFHGFAARHSIMLLLRYKKSRMMGFLDDSCTRCDVPTLTSLNKAVSQRQQAQRNATAFCRVPALSMRGQRIAPAKPPELAT